MRAILVLYRNTRTATDHKGAATHSTVANPKIRFVLTI